MVTVLIDGLLSYMYLIIVTFDMNGLMDAYEGNDLEIQMMLKYKVIMSTRKT